MTCQPHSYQCVCSPSKQLIISDQKYQRLKRIQGCKLLLQCKHETGDSLVKSLITWASKCIHMIIATAFLRDCGQENAEWIELQVNTIILNFWEHQPMRNSSYQDREIQLDGPCKCNATEQLHSSVLWYQNNGPKIKFDPEYHDIHSHWRTGMMLIAAI